MKKVYQGFAVRSMMIGIIFILFVLAGCKKEESGRGDAADLYIVKTETVSDITTSSCTLHGVLETMDGERIIQHGFCWSGSETPNVENDDKDQLGPRTSTGSFFSTISGLSKSTTYYVRAYVTDQYGGTAYGDELRFTTWSGSVTDYDGNIYGTIQIGDQLWMAENLKVTFYSDGTAVPLVEDSSAWAALSDTDKAYCWYENSTVNRDTYGGLYTWAAAMNGSVRSTANPSGVQGVCPSGWHLPSDAEWKELESFLGMEKSDINIIDWRGKDTGSQMKETGTNHWKSSHTPATNASGFTALPGGHRSFNGSFGYLGKYTVFWSATEAIESFVWHRSLIYSSGGVERCYNLKVKGYSVRCLRDESSSDLSGIDVTCE